MSALAPRHAARTERLAFGLMVASTVWCALAVAWNIGATVGAGHDALVASRGMMAENFWNWGILGPVRQYVLEKPAPDAYYTHHPFATYWLAGLFFKVFGRHAFVPRLGPVLMSIATPPLLFAIGRRLWGPVPGALAAAGYVVLPMSLAFGNLAGFEVPTAFACVLTIWGYLRFTEHWQKRWMLVSLVGVAWGVNVDWNYILFLGAALGLLTLCVVFLPQRWYGRGTVVRPYVQWALLAAAIATACVVAWVWYFHQIGALEGLLQSDAKRSRGEEAALGGVLASRRYWVDVTFTPLAVTLGKIALPILLVRIVFLRRVNEVLILAVWFMALVTYVKFKNGADVHIYWPFAFTVYFAFALGLLGQVAIGLVLWIVRWRKREDKDALVPLVVLGAMTLVPLLILPDGIDGLHYGHATGGRFNEKGSRDFRDVDKAVALQFFGASMQENTIALIHDGMRSTWALDWALHHPLKATPGLPPGDAPATERYYLADLGFLHGAEQRKLVDSMRVTVVDHFLVADRQATPAPAEASVFDIRQPNFLEWYWAYGTEPVRTIRPDAWATWEFRDAWGQAPNPLPNGAPQTPEQMRIAHNIAVSRGDGATAKTLETQLISQLDVRPATAFTDGTRLLGQHYEGGVLPTLHLYFQCTAPTTDDFEFAIASEVEHRRTGSLVPGDDKIKQLGAPFPLPPSLWKAGYIYAEHAPIHHRPGRESFAGRFEPMGKEFHAPRTPSGANEVPLITLE